MDTTATQHPEVTQRHQFIALASIDASRTNPRKHFDKELLGELVESVKKHGVIQPILVRPANGRFEIVAGERRWRAAKSAKLGEIPAIVRELSDKDALEIQVIENLQRVDLHPLEEAEGYEKLIKAHGYKADELAAKVGKSKGYIYQRLKLCALGKRGREAYLAGHFNARAALAFASIPVPELQDRAIEEVGQGHGLGHAGHGEVPAGEIVAYIRRTYMLRLDGAPFDTAAADLSPAAGACTTCPKRTGNHPELFADLAGKDDLCTDPVCFAAKRTRHFDLRVEAAKAAGRTVIEGEAAKKALPYSHSTPQGYVRLDHMNHGMGGKAKTYGQIFGKEGREKAVMIRTVDGIVEVIPSEEATKLLKAKGVKSIFHNESGRTHSQQERERMKKAQLETKVRRAIVAAVALKHSGKLSREDLELIALKFYCDIWDESRKQACRIMGWEDKGTPSMQKYLAGLPGVADLNRFLVLLACLQSGSHISTYQNIDKPVTLLAIAKRVGVNAEKIRKEIEAAAAKPKASAKKAAKEKAK